jgi:hypothetical protein
MLNVNKKIDALIRRYSQLPEEKRQRIHEAFVAKHGSDDHSHCAPACRRRPANRRA